MTHTLRVVGLTKKYGRRNVVDGVNFEMKPGEVVGFLGPNGAGKTTCFYMIVGFIRPDAGKVFLDQTEITRKPMYQRARAGISYLPQEPSVFRKLSVANNVWAILETRRDLDRTQKLEMRDRILEDLGISSLARQKAYTLSGGERRRTEIARALAIEPKFLLLDEPFAGIDPKAVADIKSIVRDLAERGIGVLITDHNVRDTLEITDRSYIISDGTIVASGSREDITNDDIARQVYLGHDFNL
jgi:ABC-type (unclassified) transport system, ATPase component